MIAHSFRRLLALSLVMVLATCTEEDSPAAEPSGGAGGAGGSSALGGAGASGRAVVPAADSGRGGAGQSGRAGAAAAVTGGTGGRGPVQAEDAGVPSCDAQCAAGERCELVDVTCVRAPCPAQPTCVPDASAADGCGSRGQTACAQGQFCDFPSGSACGAADEGGTCRTRPDACTEQYDPVCGCDGTTYGNACAAAAAGVSVDVAGECGRGAPAVNDCDPGKITCKRTAPECPEGQVPSVEGSCYGACVGIETCQCTGPAQCPQAESYTCHMSAKHCTPYLH